MFVQDVVNRIAAGEVILRPASALKELLENALDAGATSVAVQVKEGGVKLLQVQDNGSGVHVADLPLLCERHATSKLRAFDDLQSVGTFGFRGEALASISYVSHLSVVTHPQGAKHALRAEYADGVLKGAARPCAGVQGTQVTAEDLFYNVPARRRALRPASEEYARLLEVAQRYAVLFAGRALSVRKAGSGGRPDLQTLVGASRMDNLRAVYGAATARELLPVEVDTLREGGDGDGAGKDAALEGRFACEGYASSANYQAKRTTLVLFINQRLVECSPLKRALEATYASILPAKAAKPFVFLSLTLPGGAVDVNVHPTKKEVAFLAQEEVIGAVCGAVEAAVLGSNNTRTFNLTQSLLPGAPPPAKGKSGKSGGVKAAGGDVAPASMKSAKGEVAGSTKKPYVPQKLVRVDHKAGNLDAFVLSRPGAGRAGGTDGSAGGASQGPSPCCGGEPSQQATKQEAQAPPRKRRRGGAATVEDGVDAGGDAGEAAKCELSSVRELRSAVESDAHQTLLEVFQHHTWVGMADSVFGLLQHTTKLYLVNVERVSAELFYQQFLRSFGHFDAIVLSEPLPLRELLEGALDEAEAMGEWAPADGPKDEIARLCAALLTSKREMLGEYFATRIDEDGNLLSLPELVPEHCPDLRKLPRYLLRLGNEVDWEREKECFESYARVTADLYSTAPLRLPRQGTTATAPAAAADGDSASAGARPSSQPCDEAVAWAVQHSIMPACRTRLRPPRHFATDGGVSVVAALERLYRIFERC